MRSRKLRRTPPRRRLLFERLSDRVVLAASIDVAETYRGFDFELDNGVYSGTTTDSDYRDSYSGSFDDQITGSISFTSPTIGAGTFSGTGIGSGSDEVRDNGQWFACSTYAYTFNGSGAIEFDDGQLTHTGVGGSTTYTSYTSHIPGCDFGPGGSLFDIQATGTTSAASFPMPSDLIWNFQRSGATVAGSTTFGVDPSLPPRPDLRGVEVGGVPASGISETNEVTFALEVGGGLIRTTDYGELAATIDFYWGGGDGGRDVVKEIGTSEKVGFHWNTDQLVLTLTLSEVTPPTATHIVARLDADSAVQETSEANNLIAIPLYDLEVTDVEWNEMRTVDRASEWRGIDVTYEVRDLLGAATMLTDSTPTLTFYWATGTTFADRILPSNLPGDWRMLDGSTFFPTDDLGTFTFNEPALWDEPPAAATHILVVIDEPFETSPNGLIEEADEDNNVIALPVASRSALLTDSITAATSPTDDKYMVISFEPGGGSNTLSEAEVRLGVHHFNWVQLVDGPGNWTFEVWEICADGSGALVPCVLQSSSNGPIYDPIIGGPSNQLFVAVDGNDVGDVRHFDVLTSHDDKTPYLDEDVELWAYYDDTGLGGTASSKKLELRDFPVVPPWALSFDTSGTAAEPSFFMSFETKLVGVSEIDAVIPISGDGLTVRWKSNTVHDPVDNFVGGIPADRIGIFANFDNPEDLPTLAGGISDISIVNNTLLYQNVNDNADVTDDGEVDLLDAITVVNEIHRNGERDLPAFIESVGNTVFYDTSGDGHVALLDAFVVINEIHRRSNLVLDRIQDESRFDYFGLLPITEASSTGKTSIAFVDDVAVPKHESQLRSHSILTWLMDEPRHETSQFPGNSLEQADASSEELWELLAREVVSVQTEAS